MNGCDYLFNFADEATAQTALTTWATEDGWNEAMVLPGITITGPSGPLTGYCLLIARGGVREPMYDMDGCVAELAADPATPAAIAQESVLRSKVGVITRVEPIFAGRDYSFMRAF